MLRCSSPIALCLVLLAKYAGVPLWSPYFTRQAHCLSRPGQPLGCGPGAGFFDRGGRRSASEPMLLYNGKSTGLSIGRE